MRNLINPYWSNSFRGKTLEEYKCEYHNLLEKYKLKQTDNDEINFIDNEIRYIKQYIKPITENQITEAEELGEIDLIKLVIESDLSSYKKIISFLETRKSELERVSTLLEPINLLENSKFKFTNNFDDVAESKILEYFKEKLVETKYISENDLILFLKLAFDKMEVPKQKISFVRFKTQQVIIEIFYYYYKTIAGKPHGKQKKYLDLLCNYFNGFENFNIKNFSK